MSHTSVCKISWGGGGKVIAFEPMSWAYSKLKHNIELNDFNNIVIEKIALSSVNQRAQNIYFRSSWTIDPGSSSNAKKKEDINFITLDEYVRRNKINRIDFIKLDVDGYEYKIIQGARDTLKRDKPLIIIELGIYTLQAVGDNIYDLVNALSDIGYRFYSEKDLAEFPDNDTMIESIPKDGTINVLCKWGGN